MLSIAREFFHITRYSETLKTYSDDHSQTTRLSTSFNVTTEKMSKWKDFSRFHCFPLQDYVQEWPNNCPLFSARGLVLRLLETISESLGLEKKYIVKAVGKQAQHVALNYYPPCPQPELTYGLPGERIQTLISNGVKKGHRSMLVIVGDKSHGQRCRQIITETAAAAALPSFYEKLGPGVFTIFNCRNGKHLYIRRRKEEEQSEETNPLD